MRLWHLTNEIHSLILEISGNMRVRAQNQENTTIFWHEMEKNKQNK